MICLVGDILTDVTLATYDSPYKMRLGGIVHAARGLWAMGVDYAVAYFAPSYMDKHIASYLSKFNCKAIYKIGSVTGCPYTILINDAKEVGKQGYEFLYRDCISITYEESELQKLSKFEEIFMIAGNYDISRVLKVIKHDQIVHIDIANNVNDIRDFSLLRKFDTLFISTSSSLFVNTFTTIEHFFDTLSQLAKKIVLKENRGGSRAFDSETGVIYKIPSQTSTVSHSVGVGDVYDSAFIAASADTFEDRLHVSPWVAMHYAKTTFCDDFRDAVTSVLKIPIDTLKTFEGGCYLPWEMRKACTIYIAAPDFDYLNTTPIDYLCSCLTYHNFIPRRPVREVGQMSKEATIEERQRLFHCDMMILDECNMLIAVLLNNDPGTLIEIGLAVQRGMPTIVYDPYSIANNCMLTECPSLVSSDMDAIITKVFIEYSKLHKNENL